MGQERALSQNRRTSGLFRGQYPSVRVCSRGCNSPIVLDGVSTHVHDPATDRQRVRRLLRSIGDLTRMAKDRERSRQSLYREAEQFVASVDGAAARAEIDELKRQLN
jgi:hypothetical protein